MKIEQRIRFWYLRFEKISNVVEQLQSTLEAQTKLIEKVASENTQLVIELRSLQEQSEKMEFSNIELEQ